MHAKPGQERVQVAVIPYRQQQGMLDILMISARKKKHWTIPKGSYSGHHPLQEAAAITSLQEAGLQGRLSTSPIGIFIYRKKNLPCRVHVYVMEVKSLKKDWPQSDRMRRWIPLAKAADQVKEASLTQLVLKLPNFLLEAELRALLDQLPVFKQII